MSKTSKTSKTSAFTRVLRACQAGLTIYLAAAPVAQARIFTDSFQGQGEACWGNLYIRTKTIEWDTDYSMCVGSYTIIRKTFSDTPRNFDYILYKLKHVNRTCSYPYIGLYYYDYDDGPGIESHWEVMGFSRFKLYQGLQYKPIVTGQKPAPDDVLDCNLPFYSDSEKTGIPY